MKRILLVDDEVKLLRILKSSLQKKGYTVFTAINAEEARKVMLVEKYIDIVFLDHILPDTTGLELLREFVSLYPRKICVMMTAYGNIENAVKAIKAGAFDYIVKPTKLDEIILVIEKAYEWMEMKEENIKLKQKIEQMKSNDTFIGSSPAMTRIFQLIERVADTQASVLLEGESGTGKSMIARKVHQLSDRANKPFIAVNCAAIPEQLLESELFGYEKGSFTGASERRKGKFEAAHGGTIFLDEIGEISPSLQAKLLQITQEKTFMRLGSNTVQQVDVRIISATNRYLKEMVEEGLFREDLYYRLNVINIHVVPLRERRDDIPLLVEKFLDKHRLRYDQDYHMTDELMNVLQSYHWPGNVRELENAVERAVVLSQNGQLSIEDFPLEIQKAMQEGAMPDRADPSTYAYTFDWAQSLPEQMERIEKHMIIEALELCNHQAAEAARKLGISRQSLLYKLNKYSIS